MFSHNGKVSVRQVEVLLILQMFNTTILLLPKIAYSYVNRNGYILPLIGIILGLIYAYAITGLTKQFPHDTLVEFTPKIVPKVIAYIIIIVFAVKILLTTGLELRMFGEMISQVMLHKTPFPVIILMMLLTAAYLVKSGIEATGRMGEILIYFIFISLVVVFFNVAVKADYKELMPFFQMESLNVVKGTFFISLSFVPIEFMLMLTGLMRRPEKASKATILAVIIMAIIEAIIILLTYAGIGADEVPRQVWPVLTLMRGIQSGSATVENQEILMMTAWIFGIFMYISSGLYFISLIVSRSFKFKREDICVLPILPLVFFVAMWPDSLIRAYTYYVKFEYYLGIWFIVPIPIILGIISKVRRVGE